MAPRLQNTEQVLEYMDKHLASTVFRGEKQRFLPRPNFEAVTAEDVVRTLVDKDGDLHLGPAEEEEFVRKILISGRKIFATCIYAEISLACVKALFECGLSDARFPLNEDDCTAQKYQRKFKKDYLERQRLFNAAYFQLNSEQTWTGHIAKPLMLDEGGSALLGKGAFGNVYKIWIHPAQRSFTSGANKYGEFALKVTQHEGTREVSFHRAMADLSHSHLLRCLASFTFSSQYNMIYEKADCDVERFMEKNSNARQLADLGPDDLAQQLFGLADALSVIHNQGQTDPGDTSSLLAPSSDQPKTGYIHDIKPEKLLMFIYENDDGRKTYWFRLSDFSCAKVVETLISGTTKNRRSWQTVNKSGTPIYRAPEAADKGKTSRPYDLWSLGCVYLELLVWFLDGYAALNDFRDKRQCLVTPDGREDEGFYYRPQKGDNFKLRDLVVEKIQSVSERCNGSLQHIARVIPKLLKIDPRHRPTAEQLVKQLKVIDKGTRPPVKVMSGQQITNDTDRLSPPSDVSHDDSDSSFDGMIKVQHPTE
ncbi:hypothetical protein N0V95_003713 [Ascochyta clinopodiicola]|nr:hypothetical protein N0V95_003713 [Ascochyta clinopodiicola]